MELARLSFTPQPVGGGQLLALQCGSTPLFVQAPCPHLAFPGLLSSGDCQPRKSKYRGVTWDKRDRRWRVRINCLGVQHHVGRYFEEIQAACVYDKVSYLLYGDDAITNFGVGAAAADRSPVPSTMLQLKARYDRWRAQQQAALPLLGVPTLDQQTTPPAAAGGVAGSTNSSSSSLDIFIGTPDLTAAAAAADAGWPSSHTPPLQSPGRSTHQQQQHQTLLPATSLAGCTASLPLLPSATCTAAGATPGNPSLQYSPKGSPLSRPITPLASPNLPRTALTSEGLPAVLDAVEQQQLATSAGDAAATATGALLWPATSLAATAMHPSVSLPYPVQQQRELHMLQPMAGLSVDYQQQQGVSRAPPTVYLPLQQQQQQLAPMVQQQLQQQQLAPMVQQQQQLASMVQQQQQQQQLAPMVQQQQVTQRRQQLDNQLQSLEQQLALLGMEQQHLDQQQQVLMPWAGPEALSSGGMYAPCADLTQQQQQLVLMASGPGGATAAGVQMMVGGLGVPQGAIGLAECLAGGMRLPGGLMYQQ